ncbi:Uncharacterised protein [Mycobacteroides abscessus subsp. abscessus]|nr:Uncharacterised protein [Mycobacteroides abscessus subsp. abscessus]
MLDSTAEPKPSTVGIAATRAHVAGGRPLINSTTQASVPSTPKPAPVTRVTPARRASASRLSTACTGANSFARSA